jgi:hypothetical protein
MSRVYRRQLLSHRKKNLSRTPSLDLSRLESSVRPLGDLGHRFLIDRESCCGRRLAFFISGDGRFVTTAEAIGDGVNAVAKTADGGIHKRERDSRGFDHRLTLQSSKPM